MNAATSEDATATSTPDRRGQIKRLGVLTLLLGGVMISGLGDQAANTCGVLAAAAHSSTVGVAAIYTVSLATLALTGRRCGMIADRMGTGRAMAVGTVLQIAAVGLQSVVVPWIGTAWGLACYLAGTFVLNAAGSLTGTALFAAIGSSGPEVVARWNDSLVAARNTAMLLGQPAGALLFTVFGPRLSFVLDMFSFLAIGLVVLALRYAGLARGVTRGQPLADSRQTTRFRQVVAGSGLWILFAGVWVAAFGSSAEGTVFPFFVDQTLHVPTTWFGVFNAAWAAGGIIGGPLLARYQPGRSSVVRVATATMAGMALGIALPAVWPTAVITLVCFAVGGLCNGMLNAALATAVHQSISTNRYGLVWGTFGAVASAAAGAGHLLGVAGGDWPRQTVFLSGAWLCTAALGMPVASRIAARRTLPVGICSTRLSE